MNQHMVALVVASALRFVIVLIYVCVAVAAVIWRARLREAMVPTILGSSSLALANVLSLAGYFWRGTGALAGREALQHVAWVLALMNYMAQSLAVIGAASLGLAIFSDRPVKRGDA